MEGGDGKSQRGQHTYQLQWDQFQLRVESSSAVVNQLTEQIQSQDHQLLLRIWYAVSTIGEGVKGSAQGTPRLEGAVGSHKTAHEPVVCVVCLQLRHVAVKHLKIPQSDSHHDPVLQSVS